MLISTLSPRDVIRLTGQPISNVNDSRLVALAYAKFYDQRSGAVEIEIKEDKQDVGINMRFEAQGMAMLLGTLAHNVLVWMSRWLSSKAPKLSRYGLLRLVRDVMQVSGFIELSRANKVKRIVLNKAAPLARRWAEAFRTLLKPQHVAFRLNRV